jgi:signal transduction histidine kinase/CheY-like chemotaxis protein
MNIKQDRAFRKIDKRIYLVFFIVIAIAIINAVISTITIQKSQRVTNDIVNITHPSLDALANMNLLNTRSRMLTTAWVYLPNNAGEKDSLRALNGPEYIQLRTRLKSLMKYWENPEQIKSMNRIFENYDKLIEYELVIMNTLTSFEDYRDPSKRFLAEDILETQIIPLSEDISSDIKNVLHAQTDQSLAKQDEMMFQFNSLLVLVLGIALLIICSILFTAFIITRSIIVPIMQIRGIILQMGRGELPDMNLNPPRNAVGEMFQALAFLIAGFKQTSQFVEEIGKGNFKFQFEPLSNKDVQGHALLTMRSRLSEAADQDQERSWMAEGLAELNEIMRSTNDEFSTLLDKIVDTIVDKTEVQQAAVFLLHNDDLNDLHIQLGSYYALNNRILNCKRYELKEGLIGQAIASNKIISAENVNDPYFTIDTGLGETSKCNIMIIPLMTSGKVVGAIEVASINKLSVAKKELLKRMAEPIAANIFSVRANLITSQLLEESRKQTEELAFQERELRKINNELTTQSQLLQQSEEELKAQQEELKQMNNELHHKAQLLEEQNMEIEDARMGLLFKAEQLEQSNKYKSAFLANMSHELRTPLNSILILAKLLADNKAGRLTNKETEHAKIIQKSGSDLLTLINDILDLSKIESGKVELQHDKFLVSSLAEDMQLLFREFAHEKGIDFQIKNSISADVMMEADRVRIEQILKNLLSNAFKFTPKSKLVELSFKIASHDDIYNEKNLLKVESVLKISVKDQGIGISEANQKFVFEAFQQADGSTSRKFGGTGLGLTICKELAAMMGGEIHLESKENEGSTFSLFIPLEAKIANLEISLNNHEQDSNLAISSSQSESITTNPTSYLFGEIMDDRNELKTGDRLILVIEDDHVFARMLVNHCHKFGYKAIVAIQGDIGLAYAKKYKPYAIILDMRLPVMDGWTVLKKLKVDSDLNSIPVHVISSLDKSKLGLDLGATTYTNKPAHKNEIEGLFTKLQYHPENKPRKILYFGNQKQEVSRIIDEIESSDTPLVLQNTISIEECVAVASKNKFECLILDGSSNEESNRTIIKNIRLQDPLKTIPLIFIAENPDECLREVSELLLKKYNDGILDALDGAGLFLNTLQESSSNFDQVQNKMEKILTGKTILLADDDMRNIYSLTNTLEEEGIKVISAYDGLQAIEQLKIHSSEIDMVLMDIMMPNMNGFEAMTEIRKNPEWHSLPIIAVTAKAMNGDREKCMEAGASDYLMKPIQIDQLLSLIRVWLYK